MLRGEYPSDQEGKILTFAFLTLIVYPTREPMLTKQEQSLLREQLFRHLDGIVTAPSAYYLKTKGVTDYLLEVKQASLTELSLKFDANDGYLNIALRGLCSQGWLNVETNNANNTVVYSTKAISEIAFNHFEMYASVVALLETSDTFYTGVFERDTFTKMEAIFKEFMNQFGIELSKNPEELQIQQQILTHIEGLLIGPTLVRLGMTGMFHKYFMETRFEPQEFHKDYEGFSRLLDILSNLGWFNKTHGAYEFTDKGLFFAKRASAYGVTVSYLPTFRKLKELIFGDALYFKKWNKGKEEKHVNREMNVWGSGGAHTSYFKVVDNIIISIFNKPIEEQPKGVLDMGCGNGEFLKHLFSVIESQTLRGTMLEEHPLTIIGVDYNEAALKVSRANLIQAAIWAKIIWGDIGDPQQLANDLDLRYNINLSDLLNVRSFLDHNRIWQQPQKTDNLRQSNSTGAYAYQGKRLDNNLVSESLKEHFKKWAPYLNNHGLLLIELHTVKPALIAQNIGKTAATAYDATHGFSDQYIIEIEEFMTVLEASGLKADKKAFKKFPNSEIATVSINLFKTA